jgi:Tol biopolymer transport system component
MHLRPKALLACALAFLWAALLIPLALAATGQDFVQNLTESVAIADQVEAVLQAAIRQPVSETVTIGDQPSAVLKAAIRPSISDSVSLNDPVSTVYVMGPRLTTDVPSVNFATIPNGTVDVHTIAIGNAGQLPLNVGGPTISGTNQTDFAILSNGCTAPVGPSTTCNLALQFSPTAPGLRQATLSIPSNDPGGPKLLPLSGTGMISTSLQLVSSANPSSYGTQVSWTATVSSTTAAQPNPSASNGTVTFTKDGSGLCNAVALVGNQATCSANLPAGSYAMAATYSGDATYRASSQSLTQNVNPAPVTITADSFTRFYGQVNPAFTMSVTGLVNGDPTSVLGTPSFSTVATSTSPAGAYSIVPSGLSSPNYVITYINGTLTVLAAPTATTLSAHPNPAIVRRPVVLTAIVITTAQGGINPSGTGSIAFYFGPTLLGTQPIDLNGSASMTVTTLPVGRDSLTATYTGTADYRTSTSTALSEQVLQDRIVFSSYRDGNFEIYSMNPDGTNQTRLTNNPAVDTDPAVSPDGARIAFLSTRTGSAQIWVMNADGSNPQQLTADPTPAATPAWSPDGKKIAYTSLRSGSVQIWVIATDGAYPNLAPMQLTRDSFAWVNTTPAWSPDGTQIAFTSTHSGLAQIWAMSANGLGPPTQLTQNTFAAADISPAWSPDGNQIAFMSNRSGLPAIYLMSAKGGSPTRLTNNGRALDATPTWSTDGKAIAFTSTIGGVVEIYEINIDGTGLTRVTSGPAVNFLPSWSTPQAR